MSSLRLLLAAVCTLVLAVPMAAPAEEVAAFNSANLTHILNLPQVHSNGNEQKGNAGSDIEFVDIDVTNLPEAQERNISGVRSFALGGSLSAGLQIVDVTDPQAPQRASVYDCKIAQGDIQVIPTTDGRTLLTYTADYDAKTSSTCYQEAKALKMRMGNNLGTFIVDITNPYAPTTVSFVNLSKGSHNETVHPSGKWMYNSNNELTGGIGKMEIVDISDPAAPQALPNAVDLGTGIDSHDITFNAAGTRAYSAAVNHSLIFDTTDPAAPKIIGRILDPTISIHHQAEPVTLTDPVLGERNFLVVTDEAGGGSYGSTCPGGAIHVYDVTGDLEKTPVKVGVFEAPITKPAGTPASPLGDAQGKAMGCTSHVLRFYPAQQIMTIAWYNAGVHVVDISGLLGVSAGVNGSSVGAGMKELGYYYFGDSNTWSAKTNKFSEDGSFYLFANDINRGMDIFRYDAKAPKSTETGVWLTPKQAKLRAEQRSLSGKGDVKQLLPFCMLRAQAE